MRNKIYSAAAVIIWAVFFSGCAQEAAMPGEVSPAEASSIPEIKLAVLPEASRPEPVLSVIPANREMLAGEVFKLYASVSDESIMLDFISDSPEIVSVDQNGVITANSPGGAVVTVTAGNLTREVNIAVTAASPELPAEESSLENSPANMITAAESAQSAAAESDEPFYQESSPPDNFSPDEYSRQAVGLVNQERAANNLPALVIDEDMMAAAAVRAREISDNFSHVRPDGTRGGELAGTFGGIGWAAENIAMGPINPAGAVRLWMNSTDGHKESILEPRGSLTGVGCYLNENDTLYWVQLFAE